MYKFKIKVKTIRGTYEYFGLYNTSVEAADVARDCYPDAISIVVTSQ